jgi:hypothetical protein
MNFRGEKEVVGPVGPFTLQAVLGIVKTCVQ